MNYSVSQIHDALFDSYFGKSELFQESVNKSYSYEMNAQDKLTQVGEVMQSIQSKIDSMKLGGHHDLEFEQRLFRQLNSYEDFNIAIQDGQATSLFVDLTDFTTRTFHDDIHEIVTIKRGAIQIWMALALLNDGHIHSITGDGLMILFCKNGSDHLDDVLRAYATAFNFLRSMEEINERFGLSGRDKLRIKVGLDFCDNLVWNVCGLLTSQNECRGEVKATGFGIDFSAKLMGYNNPIVRSKSNLQHNQVLLFGEKARDALNLKEEYYAEYRSEEGSRPVAPYKRTKKEETKYYKVFYSDTKVVSDALGNQFVSYTDIAKLLDDSDEQPVYTLPEKSDVMYA